MTQTSERPILEPESPGPRRSVSVRTWQRIALGVLLVGTAIAYIWNISINGNANEFYAAAAQAGSQNWKALLFGSLDPANFITVDKPPLSQWVMGLSGQIFGFSSASMLIPEALMAVAAVALVYGAISRLGGVWAGLLAGSVLALTPVAALMFRFDNPDAVMVLLMTAAAYCTIRALEHASARWLALAGAALGSAFLAKMLEGLMVMPALVIAYLVVAPTSLPKRLLHLVGALVSMVITSGWYVVLTLLWPAGSRPYLAGSTDDNFMNLVLGYNGIARVLGRNHGGAPQGTGAAGQAGALNGGFGGRGGAMPGSTPAGIGRLFSGEFGYEISWLIPAALVASVLIFVARGRRPRTDVIRGGALVFGGWLIVDSLVFSYMSGTIHAYYTLAVAPAIAGLIGLGIGEMWRIRDRLLGRIGLAAITMSAGIWGFVLLQRNSHWIPDLRWLLLALVVVGSVGFVFTSTSRRGLLMATALACALVGGLGAGSAYAVATFEQPHTGGSPSVGPASSGSSARAGQFGPDAGGRGADSAESPSGAGGGGGGFGTTADSPALDALLRATNTTWSAAIDRSSAAATLELGSNTPVMAIGGFSNDPVPTLDEFVSDVADHRVTYFVQPTPVQTQGNATGRGQVSGPDGRGQEDGGARAGSHADITAWVTSHFTATTVDGYTVYDMSAYAG
ncbi:ArnT family glycosyltransferase [Rhodococcus sp. 27YEA15]|uniref:ArnT family glycosyltransferase n=1 Tax=Rhodococcus sp. 27YEA15 TaxID=3156259 RepID=UPI003C7E2FEF